YPTLSDLCSLRPVEGLSGISVRPLLENPLIPWEYPAFSQFVRPYQAAIHKRVPPAYMGYSVRTDGWRCTYWYDLKRNTVVERELYRLDGSDTESENVSGLTSLSVIESQLADLLDKYRHNNYLKAIH